MDALWSHRANCDTTVQDNYALVVEPPRAQNEATLSAYVSVRQITLINDIVGTTNMSISALTQCWACFLQMKDRLFFLLVSAASTEIIREMFQTNAPRVNRQDSNLRTEQASCEFQQLCSASSYPASAKSSVFIQSCPPEADKVREFATNHMIACRFAKGHKESLESSTVVPRLGGLQFPGITLCPETEIICTLYLLATLFRCFRQPQTALSSGPVAEYCDVLLTSPHQSIL